MGNVAALRPASAQNARLLGRLPWSSAVQPQRYLISSSTPTMDTSQMLVMNSVNRSRFFSTTVDPERLDCTPPPNSVDRPPPLARCSSTSNTTSTLVTTRVIFRANSMTAAYRTRLSLRSAAMPAPGRRRRRDADAALREADYAIRIDTETHG